VAYKGGVVERDEKEQGERKLLNLGHTVGHAIEKCSGYTIPHGHAVAAGLAIIARAAESLGWTEEGVAGRITACLAANGLPTGTEFSPEELATAAAADKKRAGNDITLVIPTAIGHCELRKMPLTDLLSVISAGWEG
jgi:3-dehydroquinate synthase